MTESALPSYAIVIVVLVVVANLATAWVVVLSMGENNGSLVNMGPPMLALLSCLSLALLHYNVIVSREVSFWASAFLGAMGFWGAWVDYVHLADRRKDLDKAREARRKAQQ